MINSNHSFKLKCKLNHLQENGLDTKDIFVTQEEILACRRIILKIVRYMKDNKMNQKDLAEKLNVSPQYINKLLHGQNVDLKITTALRYGRILGIKLIQLPEEVPASHSVTINYYQTSAPVKRTDGCAFIYTSSTPSLRWS